MVHEPRFVLASLFGSSDLGQSIVGVKSLSSGACDLPFLPRWGWELILSTAYPSKPDPFKQVQVDASYENRVMIAATYDICYCDENCLNSVYWFKAAVVFMCVGMRMREGEREREI